MKKILLVTLLAIAAVAQVTRIVPDQIAGPTATGSQFLLGLVNGRWVAVALHPSLYLDTSVSPPVLRQTAIHQLVEDEWMVLNGEVLVYTLSHQYRTEGLGCYRNGIRLRNVADFSLVGQELRIDAAQGLVAGDVLVCSYYSPVED